MLCVRLDASGTTFAFTNHLAAATKAWRDGPGVGDDVQWPVATIGGRGNEGVAGNIKRTPSAIGYVEYGIADRSGLLMARLENKEKMFVAPTGGSGLAALQSGELPPNLQAFFQILMASDRTLSSRTPGCCFTNDMTILDAPQR